MKLLISTFCLLALVAIVEPSFANQPVNVGSAVMQGQSNSAQASAGARAFEHALVKLSGQLDIAKNPSISSEIRRFENYLVASSFIERQNQEGEKELIYLGTFDQGKMIQLLQQTGSPVWSSLRPSAVLWLAQETDSGIQLATQNNVLESAQSVLDGASFRGVEVLLPIGDLEDAAAVSNYDVWGQNFTRLQQHSRRYNTENLINISISDYVDADALRLQLAQLQVKSITNQEAVELIEGNLDAILNPVVLSDIPSDNRSSQSDVQLELKTLSAFEIQMPEDRFLVDPQALSTPIKDEVTDIFMSYIKNNENPDIALVKELSLSESLADVLRNKSKAVPEGTRFKIDYVMTTGSTVNTGRVYTIDEVQAVADILDIYANKLAAEFSTTVDLSSDLSKVVIDVNNVQSLRQYRDVLNLLNTLPMVQGVELIQQNNKRSTFELSILGAMTDLKNLLRLEQRIEVSVDNINEETFELTWLEK